MSGNGCPDQPPPLVNGGGQQLNGGGTSEHSEINHDSGIPYHTQAFFYTLPTTANQHWPENSTKQFSALVRQVISGLN